MIDETYLAFQEWDHSQTKKYNLDKLKELNLIGANSQNWLRDVAKVINRRFDTSKYDKNLILSAQSSEISLEDWRPLMLWHMTRDELLLRHFLTEWLYKEYEEGAYRLKVSDVEAYLHEMQSIKLIKDDWSLSTTKRVATSLLRISSDFSLLSADQHREFNSYHLSEVSFLYLLHVMYEEYGNGHDVLNSQDWHLFLMSKTNVEQELYRLHQFRKLRFEVAGSLVDLSLPFNSAAEYIESLHS